MLLKTRCPKYYFLALYHMLVPTSAQAAYLAIIIAFLGYFLSFSVNALLAQLLGVVNYGLYSAIISVFMLLSIPIVLGFDDATVNFVPAYFQAGQFAKIRGYIVCAFKRSLPLLLLCIVIGAILPFIMPKTNQSLLATHPYLNYIWFIPLIGLMNFLTSYLIATGKNNFSLFLQTLLQSIVMVIVLEILHYFHQDLSVVQAAWLYIVTIIIVCVLGLAVVAKSSAKQVFASQPDVTLAPQWRATAFEMLILAFTNINLISVTILGVQYFAKNSHAAGIFCAINTIVGAMWVIQIAMQTIYTPKLSAVIAQQGLLMPILKRTIISCFIPGAVVLAIFIIFGHKLLAMFGVEFVAGYPQLILVGATAFIAILLIPFYWCLQYSKKIKALTRGVVIMFVLYLPVVSLLSRWFGLWGVSISYCLINLIYDIFFLILTRKEFSVLFRHATNPQN